MLCGGLWRAGSYKVGRQAAPPKVTSPKRASLGTIDTHLYVSMHYDSLIISFCFEFGNYKPINLVCIEYKQWKYFLSVCICKHNLCSHCLKLCFWVIPLKFLQGFPLVTLLTTELSHKMASKHGRAPSAHSLYCQDEEEHKNSESIKSYEMLDIETRRVPVTD